jgi:hypothetical protein
MITAKEYIKRKNEQMYGKVLALPIELEVKEFEEELLRQDPTKMKKEMIWQAVMAQLEGGRSLYLNIPQDENQREIYKKEQIAQLINDAADIVEEFETTIPELLTEEN